MKRFAALLLIFAALLTGCGKQEAPVPAATLPPTTEATTEATTEPTTVPTTEPAPVYFNPLNGEILEEPYDKRIYAVSINNLADAMPHHGVQQADIFLETYVNYSIIRGFAFYTDPSEIPAIGAVRSTRYIFTQLCKRYDLIMAHAGGSPVVLQDVKEQGIDTYNIDVSRESYYSFRDMERFKHHTWDACLFARGEGLEPLAIEKGYRVTGDPDKDYLLRFRDDGTPEDGEIADAIHMTLTFRSGPGGSRVSRKETHMLYDPALGRYIYNQYGKQMVDGATGEPESFQNVLMLFGDIEMNQYGYQIADFEAGGEGYYACGGRIIPITWGCDSDTTPLYFKTLDGETLEMGRGNTYIALMQNGSPVTYEEVIPPETEAEPAETVSADGEQLPASPDDDYL